MKKFGMALAYFPKPNPSANAGFKAYDPNDLSDAGVGGDDEEGDGGGGEKRPKAGKKNK